MLRCVFLIENWNPSTWGQKPTDNRVSQRMPRTLDDSVHLLPLHTEGPLRLKIGDAKVVSSSFL